MSSVIDVSGKLPWPMYFVLGLMYVWGLWLLITPDRVWWLQRPFVAWQYRDGHRMELSTAGRLRARFGGILSIVMSLGLGLASINWSADSRVGVEREDLDTFYYLGDPVESPGCTVRIVVCLKSDEVFPIEVTGYDEFGSVADGPGTLSRLESLPADTNLLLFVPDGYLPTHLVVDEDSDRVIVWLYGECAPYQSWEDVRGDSAADCAYDPRLSLGREVVPVSLDDGPPAGRTVIDGGRGGPVDRVE